jgi:hypothetical protein
MVSEALVPKGGALLRLMVVGSYLCRRKLKTINVANGRSNSLRLAEFYGMTSAPFARCHSAIQPAESSIPPAGESAQVMCEDASPSPPAKTMPHRLWWHRPNREMAIGVTISTSLCVPRLKAGLREFQLGYVQCISSQCGGIHVIAAFCCLTARAPKKRMFLFHSFKYVCIVQFSRKPNVTGTTVVGIPELNA